jgi:N-acetylneuraminic acid mutarotase
VRSRAYVARLQWLEDRALLSATPLLWSTGVSLPAARGGAAAVEVNGNIAVAGGATTGSATEVDQLRTTSSSWSTLPRVNYGQVSPGLVPITNGLLYYGGGGTSGTSPTSAAYFDNLSGGTSHPVASMSTARAQLAYATDSSGRAYAIGGLGNRSSNLATVERYTPSTNSWASVAPLPASRSGAAAAYDGVGAIYVAGGSPTANGTTGSNTLYKYTVSTNTWSALAPLPLNIRDAAAVVGPDGTLEVLGGISNGSAVASVETYDPSTNTWSMNTALPGAVSGAAAVVDGLGRIDLIGGFNASKAPVSTVLVSQVVNSPTAAPAFTSSPSSSSLTVASGGTFTYTAVASGNPVAGYSLVSGPSGMSVDPVSGAVSWGAPSSFAGAVPVTLSASNLLGSTPQSFTINVVDRTPPTVPGQPVVTGTGTNSVSLSWPAASDNIGVTNYSVYWIYTVGHSGRDGGFTTYTIFEGSSATNSITVNGLTQNKSYSLYVTASDAAGNRSAYSPVVHVIPGAAPFGLSAVETSPNSGLGSYNLAVRANHTVNVQLSATSYVAETFGLVNAPATMTIDPNSGVVSWSPGAADLGTTAVTFTATNQFGTTSATMTFNVSPDTPIPDFLFTNTDSPTFDMVGYPVSLQIIDHSNTPSTFSIVSGAPAGMTIDQNTGVVNWIPTPDEAGNPQVTFQVTNIFGSATLLLGPVITLASAPQNVQIVGGDTWSPTLTWSPPAYNADLVAGYDILMISNDGYTQTLYQYGNVTSAPIYMAAGVNYSVNVEAVDASGHVGNFGSAFIDYNPTVPNPYVFVLSNNGTPTTQVGQAVSLQLWDQATVLPDTDTLVSGPDGAQFDPTSGLVTWTPTPAQLGFQSFVFNVTNSSGSATVSQQIYVGPATTDTNPPNPTYAFTSNNGAGYAVVGQQVTIQVTDQNTAQPSMFQLSSGPAGMTIDPETGVLTWTPTLADLGYAYPTVMVYNSAGITSVYPTINVVFASSVTNISAVGSLSAGTIDVSWDDPLIASEPLAGYDVYLFGIDTSGNPVETAVFVPYGTKSISFSTLPGVGSYSVTVVAVDASGNEGANDGNTLVTFV